MESFLSWLENEIYNDPEHIWYKDSVMAPSSQLSSIIPNADQANKKTTISKFYQQANNQQANNQQASNDNVDFKQIVNILQNIEQRLGQIEKKVGFQDKGPYQQVG